MINWSGWQPLDIEGNLTTADLQAMGRDRSSPEWDFGVGDVIRQMKIDAGESIVAPDGDQDGVRTQEGFLFETVVDYVLAGAPWEQAVDLAFKRYMLHIRPWLRQVRLCKDRLRGTPDAVDPRVPELISIKSTRRTLRKAREQADFESNFWTWYLQEACYCYMAGIPNVRWIVWWHAGDYSKGVGSGPQVLEVSATYTPEEMESSWENVRQIAERMRGK